MWVNHRRHSRVVRRWSVTWNNNKGEKASCLCPCGWSDLGDGIISSLVKTEESYDNEDL